MRLISFIFILCLFPGVAVSNEKPIRFGLTAVIVTENTRFLDRWSQYLEDKIGRKVEFVLRRSYQEVMSLLDSGAIEFAWICGYPYVQTRTPETIRLMTVPIYRGKPSYYSYIIVPHKSSYQHLTDLKNKVFAFSDPDSNSGFLYPLSELAKKGDKPDLFFRQTFFTFNHAETVQAIAEQVADGGAVDSYIWDYLASYRPDITEKTRIIKKSPSYGFPPIVSRLGIDENIATLMKKTLENMDQDEKGLELLSLLKLDDFASYPDSIYNNIRTIAKQVQRYTPDALTKTN